jgi:hypothetical protein
MMDKTLRMFAEGSAEWEIRTLQPVPPTDRLKTATDGSPGASLSKRTPKPKGD